MAQVPDAGSTKGVNDRNVLCQSSDSKSRATIGCYNDINVCVHQLSRKARKPVLVSVSPAVFKGNVFPFHPTKLVKSFAKSIKGRIISPDA
jgi:hypothetical protein